MAQPGASSDRSLHIDTKCAKDAIDQSDATEFFDVAEGDMFDCSPKRRQRNGRQRQRLRSLHSFNSYVARTGIGAITASASMLTQQMENMAQLEGISHPGQHHDAHAAEGISASVSAVMANSQSCLIHSVGRVAGRVGGLYSNLVDAIGSPPQRVLVPEHDVPLLFLAINLCVLCTLASLALFIFAFWANAEVSDDTISGPESKLMANSITEPATRASQGGIRILATFAISLVAGAALGVRHPFQSASLAGC